MFDFVNSIFIAIPLILVMSWLVSVSSDKLGDVLHLLGVKLKVPTSVRGATFDAVASSFPEFATAMIAVLIYKEFTDVGLPTIAGSGIFNVLLIPMASILAFKGPLHVALSRESIFRDMFFYLLALFVLGLSIFSGSFTALTGGSLLLVYIGYILVLYRQTKKHQMTIAKSEVEHDVNDMSYFKIALWTILTITIIWISVDAIIASAGIVAEFLSIPKFITSVVIIAAATSIPDTLLSVKSSKRGDADGAIANAVGSNIFDICICLGLPMIIAGGSISVSVSQNIGMLAFLVISMLITASVLLKKSGVKKTDAIFMLVSYVVFLGYIAGIAFNWWS